MQVDAVDIKGLGEQSADLLHQVFALDARRHQTAAELFGEQGKLVARDPRQRQLLSDPVLQPDDNRLEQLVTNAVTQRVVDVLEVVNIQQDEGATDLAIDRLLQGHLQLLEHGTPVVQLGQIVVIG